MAEMDPNREKFQPLWSGWGWGLSSRTPTIKAWGGSGLDLGGIAWRSVWLGFLEWGQERSDVWLDLSGGTGHLWMVLAEGMMCSHFHVEGTALTAVWRVPRRRGAWREVGVLLRCSYSVLAGNTGQGNVSQPVFHYHPLRSHFRHFLPDRSVHFFFKWR